MVFAKVPVIEREIAVIDFIATPHGVSGNGLGGGVHLLLQPSAPPPGRGLLLVGSQGCWLGGTAAAPTAPRVQWARGLSAKGGGEVPLLVFCGTVGGSDARKSPPSEALRSKNSLCSSTTK